MFPSADVGPASVMLGNIVQGNRLVTAQGRDLGTADDENDTTKKVSEIGGLRIKRTVSLVARISSVLQ